MPGSSVPDANLKNCAVALDLNGRPSCLRPLRFRDLPPTFPRRTLQHLRKRQLVRRQAKPFAYAFCNSVTRQRKPFELLAAV